VDDQQRGEQGHSLSTTVPEHAKSKKALTAPGAPLQDGAFESLMSGDALLAAVSPVLLH